MTTDEIIKMAFELGLAISQSDEVVSLKEMQTKMGEDTETSELAIRFQDARTKTDNKLRDGLTLTSTEETNLDSLQKQLNRSPVVQDIIKQQEKFNNLMQGVYFAINQAMTGEECSSDCSSCGGSCGM